jgi:hypothetical protein
VGHGAIPYTTLAQVLPWPVRCSARDWLTVALSAGELVSLTARVVARLRASMPAYQITREVVCILRFFVVQRRPRQARASCDSSIASILKAGPQQLKFLCRIFSSCGRSVEDFFPTRN